MDRKTKYQVWKKRMEDYEINGQSILDWVSSYRGGLTIHQFYYWRKKFESENKRIDQNTKNSWTSFEVETFSTT
ncbi:IS66 family insertion sequence element accessory protein TnpA [Bacillus sp. 2205SS5-2]|uniref:IS66 family insertion sequence element accessory protein TnpA n=1 Tax=Bacillus sp. 2205SS5-2 TaxID=3109031 RepID=UPI0030055954